MDASAEDSRIRMGVDFGVVIRKDDASVAEGGHGRFVRVKSRPHHIGVIVFLKVYGHGLRRRQDTGVKAFADIGFGQVTTDKDGTRQAGFAGLPLRGQLAF